LLPVRPSPNIQCVLPGIAYSWPILLGGQAHWTVGLVATLMAISSIIAADTFAFLCGRVCSLLTHFLFFFISFYC